MECIQNSSWTFVGERPLGRSKGRWEDTNMDLRENQRFTELAPDTVFSGSRNWLRILFSAVHGTGSGYCFQRFAELAPDTVFRGSRNWLRILFSAVRTPRWQCWLVLDTRSSAQYPSNDVRTKLRMTSHCFETCHYIAYWNYLKPYGAECCKMTENGRVQHFIIRSVGEEQKIS
jgi:hypothetical protein